MGSLDFEFDRDGRRLVLRADLASGWRSKRRTTGSSDPPKTYYFSEKIRAEWQGGFIDAQLSIFPRPGGLTSEWALPPSFKAHGPVGVYPESPFGYVRHVDGTQTTVSTADCCQLDTSEPSILRVLVDLMDDQRNRPHQFRTRQNKGGLDFFERIALEKTSERVFGECDIHVV